MYSTLITVAAGINVAFSLFDAITGVAIAGVSVSQIYPNARPACSFRSIQSDTGNGGAKVFRGDCKLSTINYGKALLAADAEENSTPMINGVFNKGTFLMADTNPTKILVEWDYA